MCSFEREKPRRFDLVSLLVNKNHRQSVKIMKKGKYYLSLIKYNLGPPEVTAFIVVV